MPKKASHRCESGGYKLVKHRAYHYNVRPRYSAGSPAMVDEDTAMRVKRNELDGYEIALSGAVSAAEKARAERLGLSGIVEQVFETSKNWHVHDLITGEVREEDFGTR